MTWFSGNTFLGAVTILYVMAAIGYAWDGQLWKCGLLAFYAAANVCLMKI